MKTIETIGSVTPDHQMIVRVQVPADIAPGDHRVFVMLDDETARSASQEWSFPVIDIGPWPLDLSLRREDMYGDDGR